MQVLAGHRQYLSLITAESVVIKSIIVSDRSRRTETYIPMRTIEFIPKKGILHIDFGMARDKVKQIMKSKYDEGKSEPKGDNTDCYFESSLQFSFEKDNT